MMQAVEVIKGISFFFMDRFSLADKIDQQEHNYSNDYQDPPERIHFQIISISITAKLT